MLVPESPRLDDLGLDPDDVLRARSAASGRIRAAASVWYVVPADSEDIADTETKALIESYGIDLALADLTRAYTGGTEGGRISAKAAEAWLLEVAAGNFKLELERRQFNEVGAPRSFQAILGPATTRPLSPWGS